MVTDAPQGLKAAFDAALDALAPFFTRDEADFDAYLDEGPTCPVCDGIHGPRCPIETNDRYREEVDADERRAAAFTR